MRVLQQSNLDYFTPQFYKDQIEGEAMRSVRIAGKIRLSVGFLWMIATLPPTLWMVLVGKGDDPIPSWYPLCFPLLVVGVILWGIGSIDRSAWRSFYDWIKS